MSSFLFNILIIALLLFDVNITTNITGANERTDSAAKVVFDEENVQTLVEDAIDYAHNVFLIVRTQERKDISDYAQIVPFTLFPSPYPREMFKEAIDVAKAMSLLYFRVSRDFEFLKMVYKDLLESDVSIRNYMKICEEVLNEGIKQPFSIYLQRADYYVHVREDGAEKKYELKQIEVNGGSAGGANGIPPRITKLHERTLSKAGIPNLPEDVLPKNPIAKAGAAEAVVHAWRLYKQKFTHPDPIIVFLVLKDNSYWHFLKRYDEYEIEQIAKNKIKVVYMNWHECVRDLTMDDDFTLRLKGQAVAVFYTNIVITGAKLSAHSIETFKMIERSTAIKSLSLFYELSVSKKVQQTLSLPGMVERFFPDPKEAPMVDAIRKTFARMWGLENDDQETREIVADAIAHPERYVMKPNREGGGKNFWDQEIADKLRTLAPKERAAYILMEKLNPLTVKNYLVWPFKEVVYDDVVVELGVYTFMVGNMQDGTMSHYAQPGHLVRTKLATSNEGGISTGTGAFDSVYLH